MNRIDVTAPARHDIDQILRVSRTSFGEEAAERYRSLLLRGLIIVRDAPDGPLTTSLGHLRPGVRSLHLRAVKSPVRTPRHRLVYGRRGDTVIVLRVVHDRMDLERAFR